MDQDDSFVKNIAGVTDLVGSGTNKTAVGSDASEGVSGEYEDILDLPMSDAELLELKDQWEGKWNGYGPKVEARQKKNKLYYEGRQRNTNGETDGVVSSNLLFEAEETFIPQALSKNPEPVVWSDDTDEGKEASNDLKTMLQYHADVLCLRKKLGVMVRHWSIYFLGVVKHGWDVKTKDIELDIRKPQNFILDPNGYIDEYGNFVGDFLGERIEITAEKLIEKFPKSKAYIFIKANGKLGTTLVYTEWWTDDYCFSTLMDEVLDKHKNEFFNYDQTAKNKDEYGNEVETVTPGINHFAVPKMPYTFLSVFSLQEHPHDITNLIEQNIPNQDEINDTDNQIAKNLRAATNAVKVSGLSFNAETARQAVEAMNDTEVAAVLIPDGKMDSLERLPASPLPGGLLESLQTKKDNLRAIFGTSGLVPNNDPEQAVRNNILAESHDSSRIGGGIGDALEQVADNIFNWWVQLYCVFYDEPHYGAVMGNGHAVAYVQIVNTNMQRKFVVSVAPNSMQPKDEISKQNMAMERWKGKAIDPISFMKEINDSDPLESAKKLVLWTTNPQMYAMIYFPEVAPPAPVGAPAASGGPAPVAPGSPPPTLAAAEASTALSQVPINAQGLPK